MNVISSCLHLKMSPAKGKKVSRICFLFTSRCLHINGLKSFLQLNMCTLSTNSLVYWKEDVKHIGLLTHWGPDKMAAISQTIFKGISLNENFRILTTISQCSLGSNWQYGSISSDNGLVPNRRQAIIWANNALGYWRIYALLCLNELIVNTVTHSGVSRSTIKWTR